MALVLHAHPLSSYCWKALIALHEHGLDFELAQVELMDAAKAAIFRALWPLGRMPVLVDDGRRIVESSIIVEWLDLHHSKGARMVPADPEAAIPVRTLDRIFDNHVMAPMQKIVGDRLRSAGDRDPVGVRDAHALIETACVFLEDELAGRTWAAGETFSLADCAAAPSLHYADRVHPLRDRFPVLGSCLARLEERPSFAVVLEAAAPFRHLFPEE